MTDKVQYGFYVDTTRCNGCKACHIACKDRQGTKIRAMPNGEAGSVPALNGVTWRRVYEYAGGSIGENVFSHNVFAYYMSIGCNHCSNPVCVKACPTGAMHKRSEDGLVHVAEELCIGCESCARACPYDAPQIDTGRRIMTKCDGCYDRLQKDSHGNLTVKPTCVEACPQRALDFDNIEVLRNKYGNEAHIAPLVSESLTNPNLVIKAGRHAKPAGDESSGQVINPNEV